MAGYAFDRLLTTNTPLGCRPRASRACATGSTRVVPAGIRSRLLAYPVSRDWGQSAILWWDAEFWNNRASVPSSSRTARTRTRPSPAGRSRLDFAPAGSPGPSDAPPFVLAAPNDSRFGLAGAQTAANVGLVLREVERPYRVAWATAASTATAGRDPAARPRSGSTRHRAGRRRAHGRGAARRAAGGAARRPPTGSASRAGRSHPGTRVQPCARRSCIPRGGHADLTLAPTARRRSTGPPLGPEPGPVRDVGVAVSGVRGDARAGDRAP